MTQEIMKPTGSSVAAKPSQALSSGDPITDMIGRIASDPDADIETLERMIALRDSEQSKAAEREFNLAFSNAQRAMPAVPKRGKGYSNDYALWEDVNEKVISVLSTNGLSISYTSKFEPDAVIVTATLRHIGGHSISGDFFSPIESPINKNGKPSMNKAQQRGSAMSYGKRYVTINLLSLTTYGDDDDGFSISASDQAQSLLDAIKGAPTVNDIDLVHAEIMAANDLSSADRKKVIGSFTVRRSALLKQEG